MSKTHFIMRLIASLMLATLPIISFGAPASAYDRAEITNKTPFAAQGTIFYAACRSDNFVAAAGAKNSPTPYRAACLIVKITATVNGKAAVPFVSEGSSKSKFEIVSINGEYRIGLAV